jgi:hypothetical protein
MPADLLRVRGAAGVREGGGAQGADQARPGVGVLRSAAGQRGPGRDATDAGVRRGRGRLPTSICVRRLSRPAPILPPSRPTATRPRVPSISTSAASLRRDIRVEPSGERTRFTAVGLSLRWRNARTQPGRPLPRAAAAPGRPGICALEQLAVGCSRPGIGAPSSRCSPPPSATRAPGRATGDTEIGGTGPCRRRGALRGDRDQLDVVEQPQTGARPNTGDGAVSSRPRPPPRRAARPSPAVGVPFRGGFGGSWWTQCGPGADRKGSTS